MRRKGSGGSMHEQVFAGGSGGDAHSLGVCSSDSDLPPEWQTDEVVGFPAPAFHGGACSENAWDERDSEDRHKQATLEHERGDGEHPMDGRALFRARPWARRKEGLQEARGSELRDGRSCGVVLIGPAWMNSHQASVAPYTHECGGQRSPQGRGVATHCRVLRTRLAAEPEGRQSQVVTRKGRGAQHAKRVQHIVPQQRSVSGWAFRFLAASGARAVVG